MTSNIKSEASFKERADRLETVRQAYVSFREKIESKFKLSNDDGRFVFLQNIISMSRTTVVFLYLFDRCVQNPKFAVTIFGLSNINSIGPIIRNANKFLKSSWYNQFQFQLETLFKNILKSVGADVPKSYWNISKNILKSLEIPDIEDKHLKLNILAFMRNSQHNNGIHVGYKGKDTKINVDGVDYEFIHGEIAQCATWDHIAHIWLKILPILEEIYFSEKVKNITSAIPSYYLE